MYINLEVNLNTILTTKPLLTSPELVLQVRKVIVPFAAPKKIYIINDMPKARSGKIMRRIMRKIVAGEGDQLGDLGRGLWRFDKKQLDNLW